MKTIEECYGAEMLAYKDKKAQIKAMFDLIDEYYERKLEEHEVKERAIGFKY